VPWVDPDGEPPYIGSLSVNPADASLHMGTNTGLFRVEEGSPMPEKVSGTLTTPDGYVDNDPQKGLRDPLNQFKLVTEPWLFVVGADGKVTARLEGSFGLSAFEDAVKTCSWCRSRRSRCCGRDRGSSRRRGSRCPAERAGCWPAARWRSPAG